MSKPTITCSKAEIKTAKLMVLKPLLNSHKPSKSCSELHLGQIMPTVTVLSDTHKLAMYQFANLSTLYFDLDLES